jgi:hypothetical protein
VLVQLDPGERLDVCQRIFSLARASEVLAVLKTDFKDAVETLGLIQVPYGGSALDG